MIVRSFHHFHPQAGAVADAASAAAADTARRTAVAGAQAAQKAAQGASHAAQKASHVLGDARRSGQAAAEKALGSLMRAGGLAKKPKEAVLRDARDEAAREEEELQAVLALSLKEFEAQQAKSVDESPAAKHESSPWGQASTCQEENQGET